MALPTVERQYLAHGNCPPPEDENDPGEGDFPVLLLSDGSRVVGNKGQKFEALVKQAQDRGQVA